MDPRISIEGKYNMSGNVNVGEPLEYNFGLNFEEIYDCRGNLIYKK
ncbi:MAG: hypothetical protein Q8Q35_04230 [Nanoarchaeota archaeon]|nr:hypothetical protein [Nanoarchaeota archaeon]